MSRRSKPLVLLVTLAVALMGCGTGQQSAAPSSGAPSSPGTSGPAGSPDASQPLADISGAIEIGARLGCEPFPCEPEEGAEGAADEIAWGLYPEFG